MKNLVKLSMLMVAMVVVVACSKDDGPEIVASVNSTSMSPGNFNGDVTGNGGSTTETFSWTNNQETADYNMDITSGALGTFRFQMSDASGATVLDRTLVGGTAPDTFSGTTSVGVTGEWTVTLTLSNFNGDGSYSATSGN